MYRLFFIAVLTVSFALSSQGGGNPAAGADQSKGSQKKKESSQSKRQAGASSLTGCVDQQDGHYVLTDDRTLKPIADLAPEGFPVEGFAKHLGHKVTVRGTSSAGGTRPLFKVRSIETVSDVCAPQTQHD